jgi:hypothetical protein
MLWGDFERLCPALRGLTPLFLLSTFCFVLSPKVSKLSAVIRFASREDGTHLLIIFRLAKSFEVLAERA